MTGVMTQDMRHNYSIYVSNVRAKDENPVDFDTWINDYVRSLKEKLFMALQKSDKLDAFKKDPQFSYGGSFPINRLAIECRNADIDKLEQALFASTSRPHRNVLDEQARQLEKWGEQNHDPYTFLAILLEEVGEYAQACLQTQFGGPKGGYVAMREEAVHVAAVAMSIVECLDRSKWHWPTPVSK